MRRFMPGGGGEPSSSSSSGGQHRHQHGERGGDDRAAAAAAAAAAGQLRYGAGGHHISLGHGHDDGRPRLGVGGDAAERRRQVVDGSMDMLARHSSSPAVLFSNLAVMDNGYPSSKAGSGSGAEPHHHPSTTDSNVRKMKPSSSSQQLNFTRQQQQQGAAGHFSPISEDGAFPPPGRSSGESSGAASRSFSGGSFSIVGPWEESRDIIIATLGAAYDPHQFSGAMASTTTTLEMDRYVQQQLQPQDHHHQVVAPFKVRAKRGCATHPRSIAERERRTRISEKLRKLQELVPSMDKQTSTADMLDLAVEHIKGLQSELQTLKHEQEKCTCCRKR